VEARTEVTAFVRGEEATRTAEDREAEVRVAQQEVHRVAEANGEVDQAMGVGGAAQVRWKPPSAEEHQEQEQPKGHAAAGGCSSVPVPGPLWCWNTHAEVFRPSAPDVAAFGDVAERRMATQEDAMISPQATADVAALAAPWSSAPQVDSLVMTDVAAVAEADTCADGAAEASLALEWEKRRAR
jgi:hypothetical protein